MFGNIGHGYSAQWIDAVLGDFDAQDAGWAWWQWRENQYWGIVGANGQIVNLAALRHLARPYVVAAPAGVHAGRGDGVTGRLILKVTASHADQPVEIGWSALTLSSPIAKGTCLNTSAWDAASARLTLGLDSGAGCQITISVS